MHNWKYKDGEIISLEDTPSGSIGFAYLITNRTTGKIYVGRKNLTSTRKKHYGKKKLASLKDKRLKTYEMVTKESNWKVYTGSNKELNADIKRGDEIDRTILQFAYNKIELTYLEVKYQCIHGVLECESYNDNILGKFYRKNIGDGY